jgi:hypothetical protein
MQNFHQREEKKLKKLKKLKCSVAEHWARAPLFRLSQYFQTTT